MTVPIRFTSENTEGYTQPQLDELNSLFEQAVYRELGDAPDVSQNPGKSTADHIAERVLAEFDVANSNL